MQHDNVYSAPESEFSQEPVQPESEAPFYPVSMRKFVVLYISTMGIYSLVWFYKNWRRQGREMKEKIWPAARALFQIFFTHSLFRRVEQRGRRAGIDVGWSTGGLATLYIVLLLTDNVITRATLQSSGGTVLDAVGIILVPILMFPLWLVQKTINQVNRDPEGRLNDRFTGVNWFFITVGTILWIFSLLGFAEPHLGILTRILEMIPE